MECPRNLRIWMKEEDENNQKEAASKQQKMKTNLIQNIICF